MADHGKALIACLNITESVMYDQRRPAEHTPMGSHAYARLSLLDEQVAIAHMCKLSKGHETPSGGTGRSQPLASLAQWRKHALRIANGHQGLGQ